VFTCAVQTVQVFMTKTKVFCANDIFTTQTTLLLSSYL